MASPEITELEDEEFRLARWRLLLNHREPKDTDGELIRIARIISKLSHQWADVEICGVPYKRCFLKNGLGLMLREDAIFHLFDAAGLSSEGLALTHYKDGYLLSIPAASFDPVKLKRFARYNQSMTEAQR